MERMRFFQENGLKRLQQCIPMSLVELLFQDRKEIILGYQDQLDKGILWHPTSFFYLPKQCRPSSFFYLPNQCHPKSFFQVIDKMDP